MRGYAAILMVGGCWLVGGWETGAARRWPRAESVSGLRLRGGTELDMEMRLGYFGDLTPIRMSPPPKDELDRLTKQAENSEWRQSMEKAMAQEYLGKLVDMPSEILEKFWRGEEMLLPGIMPQFEANIVAKNKKMHEEQRQLADAAEQQAYEAKALTETFKMEQKRRLQRLNSKKDIMYRAKRKKEAKRVERHQRWKSGIRPRPTVSSSQPLVLQI